MLNEALAINKTSDRNIAESFLAEVREKKVKREQADAQAKVESLVSEAEALWKNGLSGPAEQKLAEASKLTQAKNLASVQQLRTRMANARVEELVAGATSAVDADDIETAKARIKDALAVPNATTLDKAKQLDQQIANATDAARLRSILVELPDDDFRKLQANGTMPASLITGIKSLDHRTATLAKAEVGKAAGVREDRRLAQLEADRKREEERQKAIEADRKKKEQDRLKAEADQRKADAEAAEAKRKAEEEHDENGLVLMLKTVKGEVDQFGFVNITGTVVNRRDKKLKYAQITFNVYDASGALVGNALANINDLEPGGRWNFKAISLKKGKSYKFSELSGF